MVQNDRLLALNLLLRSGLATAWTIRPLLSTHSQNGTQLHTAPLGRNLPLPPVSVGADQRRSTLAALGRRVERVEQADPGAGEVADVAGDEGPVHDLRGGGHEPVDHRQ